jgi:peroxiredoxin
MKANLWLIPFVIFIYSIEAAGQGAYKIDFKVKGFTDSVAYLGNYFWENTYIIDTARVNKNGSFSFSGSKSLPNGVFLLLTKGKGGNIKIFELVVGDDQVFTLETSYENPIGDMKVTGDLDNQIYFDHLNFNYERNKEAEPLVKILRDSSIRSENKMEAREKFNAVGQKVKSYQNDLSKKYPTTVTARMLKANSDIEVPLTFGDQNSRYNYFKAHYWDNFNVADDALLRLPNPLFKEKLEYFLDKMVLQNPDSLIKEIDKLASIARKNKETYKFLIWKCLGKYQSPEIMGLDAVFVHLSDKYVSTGELDFWMDKKTKKNIIDQAAQLSRSLIGQTAANLIMQDQNLQPRNMYDIKNKYTILFIFDPDCGHCREETPKLVNFYNAHKKKFDVEVYAVSADTSIQKMKKYIQEMKMPWITVNGPRSYVGSYQKLYDAAQTPSLYIIDNQKKIIAKKPPIEKLEEFLSHYEESQKKKKSAP